MSTDINLSFDLHEDPCPFCGETTPNPDICDYCDYMTKKLWGEIERDCEAIREQELELTTV